MNAFTERLAFYRNVEGCWYTTIFHSLCHLFLCLCLVPGYSCPILNIFMQASVCLTLLVPWVCASMLLDNPADLVIRSDHCNLHVLVKRSMRDNIQYTIFYMIFMFFIHFLYISVVQISSPPPWGHKMSSDTPHLPPTSHHANLVLHFDTSNNY